MIAVVSVRICKYSTKIAIDKITEHFHAPFIQIRPINGIDLKLCLNDVLGGSQVASPDSNPKSTGLNLSCLYRFHYRIEALT